MIYLQVFRRYSFLADSNLHVDSRMDLSDPDILGAPCSAVDGAASNPHPNPNPNLNPKPLTLTLTLTPRQVDGAASLSSYVDSPFYAVLLVRVRVRVRRLALLRGALSWG